MTEKRFATFNGVKSEVVKEMDFGEYKIVEIKMGGSQIFIVKLVFINTATDEYLITPKNRTGNIFSTQIPSTGLLQLFRKFCHSIGVDIVWLNTFSMDDQNKWRKLGLKSINSTILMIWADPGRSDTLPLLDKIWVMKGKHPLDDVPDVHQLEDLGKRAKSSD